MAAITRKDENNIFVYIKKYLFFIKNPDINAMHSCAYTLYREFGKNSKSEINFIEKKICNDAFFHRIKIR